MLDKREGLNWRNCTNPYRENIDLATLFWVWRRYEPKFDPFKKIEEIVTFFDQEQMLYVYPRELWGSMLGGGKLKAGEVVSAEDIILTSLGARARKADDKDRYLFEERAWLKVCDIALNTQKPCKPFDLVWMLRYRRALNNVTPYSDYQIVRSKGKSHLVFMEDHINQSPDDLLKMGVVDINGGFELLEGLTPTGIHPYNPIVGDVAYTHAFINLDEFVEACDEIGYEIPDVFRRPDSFNNVKAREYQTIDFDIKFPPNEQFATLLVAKRVQEFLTLDRDGFILLSNGKVAETKAELKRRITDALGEQDNNLVGHIWAVLMPIEGEIHRAKGKKLIRGNLREVIQAFWGKDGELMSHKRPQRLKYLKDRGYSSNESGAILAMITPAEMNDSTKPSKHFLNRCREQILAMDLSWLEKDFP